MEEEPQTREREGRTQRTLCRRGIEGADCGVGDPGLEGEVGGERGGAEHREQGHEGEEG